MIHHLGGRREFPRLRIGISRLYLNSMSIGCKLYQWLVIGIGRPSGRIEAFNFVLRAFSNQESEEVSKQTASLYKNDTSI